MSFPTKIVSGGQTGADRAGLDFALDAGLELGGYVPKGRRCEGGVVPDRYPMTETDDWKYPERTRLNVRDSDATVIFNAGPMLSTGSSMTAQFCRKLGRPFVVIRGLRDVEGASHELAGFLALHRPVVLNVAGNREETTPGIWSFVKGVLARTQALAVEATRSGFEPPPQPKQMTFKL